jgi:hypothetical protein
VESGAASIAIDPNHQSIVPGSLRDMLGVIGAWRLCVARVIITMRPMDGYLAGLFKAWCRFLLVCSPRYYVMAISLILFTLP